MSDITPVDLQDELFDSFVAFWAGRSPISLPNYSFDPAKVTGDEWVRLFILGDVDGQQSLSTSVSRNHVSRTGILTFEVYVREGDGLTLAYQRIDEVNQWLAKPALATAMFTVIGAPVEGGRDGAWTTVAMSANWRYLSDRAA